MHYLYIVCLFFLINSNSFAVDNFTGVQSALGMNPASSTGSSTTSSTEAPPAPPQPSAGTIAPMQSLIQTAPNTPSPPTSFSQINPQIPNSTNRSEVFGANLFTGSFARAGVSQFNPDYIVAIGDQIQVRLWGGFNFDSMLVVDPQGNIFLPQVGPVKVLGARNKDLQNLIEGAVKRLFLSNVYSYASLAAAQPVRVFVGGFVNRPGLYNGTSMDSLLHYLDQAGGIDLDRGSFLNVQVKRGEQVRSTVNLYDFLLAGTIPLIQLADGDVIFINPRQNTVQVSGFIAGAKPVDSLDKQSPEYSTRFEFQDSMFTIGKLAILAKPKAEVTHVRITRNTGTIRNVEYYALAEANNVPVGNGDEVEFTADKRPGTITVRVEGEHKSPQEYVLPYGTRFGALIKRIQFSPRSDKDNLQLFRLSVKERQKEMLTASLKSLETTVLTARSGTTEEAMLRKEEAAMILQWVERAKNIEPTGQVLIAQAATRDDLLLENGDIVKVPVQDGLVLVSGEVMFPNTIAYDKSFDLDDYIDKAGGYTQNDGSSSRIVIAHRDGSFNDGGSDPELRPGDEVLVLPEIEVKSRQLLKDLSQIIYQIAIAARVVVDL